MIFVGIDWAERHHDVCVMDESGGVLGRARISDGVDGVRALHEVVGEHAADPAEVTVGIETDRGLLVGALVSAGYRVFAINPLAASRYRDRHHTSRAKSDRGDAKVLADLVRTDRHNHREVAGDSELAEAVKILARAHQTLVWTRQRQVNQLRSTLREFYPAALAAFGTDLAASDAVSVLERLPTPSAGARASRSQIVAALRRGGRERNLTKRSEQIVAALRSEQLAAPELVEAAYGDVVQTIVGLIADLNARIDKLEHDLADRFEHHPDAEILSSLPGLGLVLGARVLGEFGDDRTRFADAKARRCYAGTAPITRASGKKLVVVSRLARNRRLADACYLWAFCSLTHSPGARRHYDRRRAKGDTHHQALRSLANRLVGVLHGCVTRGESYREDIAFPPLQERAA